MYLPLIHTRVLHGSTFNELFMQVNIPKRAATPSAFIVICLFIMELKGIILLHISPSFILLGEMFKRLCGHLELITVKFSAMQL